MSKVRDDMADKYIEEQEEVGYIAEAIVKWAYVEAWDECLRSEPRVLALVEALELLPCLVIKTSGGFGDADKIKHSHDCLKCKALAAFKEGK
jgi:hypothetical protein